MTDRIPFVKMHGLGNDFVIILEDALPSNWEDSAFIPSISSRIIGIGCDQFITYKQTDSARFAMSIYNQDGGVALACGNASRCLSRLIFDETGLRNITLTVAGGRVVLCEYISKDAIKVNMGVASFSESWMPESSDLWNLVEHYPIEPKEMICVDVANPHLVIFSQLSDQDKKLIGKNFQKTDLFKGGVNVSFARVEDDKIHLKVWERGTGFTYACGSGAIATFAAAVKLGFAKDEAEIIFKLGSLKMKTIDGMITICGSASYVFQGNYFYE
ncbi:MAG: diaminopimelate epimerase [Rickettsiales bacterium]|nr:MAG: diaminopimelate epimerase [Rickettsiales bacterium]